MHPFKQRPSFFSQTSPFTQLPHVPLQSLLKYPSAHSKIIFKKHNASFQNHIFFLNSGVMN